MSKKPKRKGNPLVRLRIPPVMLESLVKISTGSIHAEVRRLIAQEISRVTVPLEVSQGRGCRQSVYDACHKVQQLIIREAQEGSGRLDISVAFNDGGVSGIDVERGRKIRL